MLKGSDTDVSQLGLEAAIRKLTFKHLFALTGSLMFILSPTNVNFVVF
jgi:hypothetical protein